MLLCSNSSADLHRQMASNPSRLQIKALCLKERLNEFGGNEQGGQDRKMHLEGITTLKHYNLYSNPRTQN